MRDSAETDMPLASDGQGRLYVPGTSLAGPMRAWLCRCFPQLADSLCGFQEEGGDRGAASMLFVEDARVSLPGGLEPEIWDGVGIDREWGVAADGVKYDRAILPIGTTLDLELTVEIPPQDLGDPTCKTNPQAVRAVIGHLLEALAQGKIGFGAARTRGLGNVKLREEGLKIVEENWSSKEGILALLANDPTRLTGLTYRQLKQSSPTATLRPLRQVGIVIGWEPDGPVMVKAGQDGVSVDMLPMLSGIGSGQLSMLLPGSSLKGVLRSQAERIIRTVLERDPVPKWNGLNTRRRHMDQVAEPLIREVFGSAKHRSAGERSDQGKPQGEEDHKGNRGALGLATCYATNLKITPSQWRTIAEAASDDGQPRPGRSPLYQAMHQAHLMETDPPSKQPYLQQAHHVAVDRWTGGAAEGFLYSTLEPFNITWDPIVMTLDLDSPWLPEELHKPAVALLLLLVRDLAMNRIPIGFAGNRGYGSIKVEHVDIQPEGFDWLKPATLSKLGLGELTEVSELRELQDAWSRWIETNRVKPNQDRS
jgi:CRISPR/Cas system CSM-associated protein Csm3 (group 7 of RAMP superfamily)